MADVKPCPFCGHKPLRGDDGGTIYCPACHTAGPRADAGLPAREFRKAAVSLWNNRARPTAEEPKFNITNDAEIAQALKVVAALRTLGRAAILGPEPGPAMADEIRFESDNEIHRGGGCHTTEEPPEDEWPDFSDDGKTLGERFDKLVLWTNGQSAPRLRWLETRVRELLAAGARADDQ